MAKDPSTDHPTSPLRRQITLGDATAIFIGIILGSGIFVAPSAVANATHHWTFAIGIWVLGGLIAACGAAVYAECGARLPYDGGFYVFYRTVYGEAIAFVGGWAALLVTYPASIAAIAWILAAYLGHAVPALAGAEPFTAAAAVAVVTWLNLIGVRENALTQRVLTGVKVLALAAVCIAALVATRTGAAPPHSTPLAHPSETWAGFLSALTIVLWTYGGWSDITLVSGELEHPARNLSRTVLFGIGSLVTLYGLVQAAVLVVLPWQSARISSRVLSDAVSAAFGLDAGRMVATLVVLCTFGALNAMVMVVSRLEYAMSADGVMPRVLCTLSRRGVPVRSVLAIGTTSLAYVAWGNFDQLLGMFTFSVWLFYALTAVALLILRRRQTGEPLLWRAPLGPVAPMVVLLTAVALTGGLLWSDTQRHLALSGALLLCTGFPAYYAWRAVRNRGLSAP